MDKDDGTVKIYIASKANMRPTWRALKLQGVPFNSRWIDVDDKYSSNSEGLDYSALWTECIEDVFNCDFVIAYIHKGDILKGALIEIGAALVLNKRVLICGDLETIKNNGTWSNHKNVIYCGEFIEDALKHA